VLTHIHWMLLLFNGEDTRGRLILQAWEICY
jgi:hypothetical protein